MIKLTDPYSSEPIILEKSIIQAALPVNSRMRENTDIHTEAKSLIITNVGTMCFVKESTLYIYNQCFPIETNVKIEEEGTTH